VLGCFPALPPGARVSPPAGELDGCLDVLEAEPWLELILLADRDMVSRERSPARTLISPPVRWSLRRRQQATRCHARTSLMKSRIHRGCD
jgi:hypothetical protein